MQSNLFNRVSKPARTTLARRNVTSAVFEAMEQRQLMSAVPNSIKAIDSGGPDNEIVEAGGTVYVISSHASGGGWTQIWASKGPAASTKMLVDLRKAGEKINSLENLTATTDGRVFFTATGGTGGGRQLFQLNTSKGGYTQITSDTSAFYTEVMAIGNKLYLYDSTNTKIMTLNSKNKSQLVVDTQMVKWYEAKGQLFYSNGDEGLWRTDGTANGTYKITDNLFVGNSDVFVSNDHIYFEGSFDNNTSLWRSDGSNSAPVKIANDFSFSENSSAEFGDYVYFSGGYYNTSPNAKGHQLYRVSTSTGAINNVTEMPTSNGGGIPRGISVVGKHIYFTAGDTDFITSQGTPDRELYRYSTEANTVTKITTEQTLYPIDIGGGVLSSYYFVAAPTKDDARWGSRKLYRTSPTDDAVVEVGGLPSYTDSNAETKQLVASVFAGSAGFFYSARNMDQAGDYDTYFVPTPYSYIDPVTQVLNIQATEGADVLSVKVDGDELVMNLNGLEERQDLADFTTIYISLKAGDDKLTTNANVFKDMSVNGDSGNDSIMTGSGNDSILAGSGKNYMYGMAGDDRLRGSNGYDYAEGGDGNDRLYGRAGSDFLLGGNGVDKLYGDDSTGLQGNDTLYGGSSNDRLYGYGGNDELYGGKQNDFLEGGAGNDKLLGNEGNDTLDAGAGIDTVYGNDGNDWFYTADGELDLLYGGAGTNQAEADDEESIFEELERVG